MSDPERLQLAQRMSALLQRELGERVDGQRMLAQPLYARDVLLVCRALTNTDGPELAQRFETSDLAPAVQPLPAAALDVPDSAPPDSIDSTPSGWVASLWPSTMRGGWLAGKGRKRSSGKTPPRS